MEYRTIRHVNLYKRQQDTFESLRPGREVELGPSLSPRFAMRMEAMDTLSGTQQ